MNDLSNPVLPNTVLQYADADQHALAALLQRYGMVIQQVDAGEEIPGSFWGDEEAGLKGHCLLLREDTPLHSALHEACHYICMDAARRSGLDTNAGGDYDEENVVCYLQILLADQLPGFSSACMMQDMDAWGYSFRLGSARAWFEQDASDARQTALAWQLIDPSGQPTFRLRDQDTAITEITMPDKKPLPVPRLETERLLIRRLRMDDAAAMLQMLSDAETVRYWGRPVMTELEQAEEYTRENLRWMDDGHCLYWGLEEKASGRMIGTCTLFKLDSSNRRGEIGYLLNRAYWHQGFMSETLKRVIDFAFNDLQLHRLEADTDPENAASIRLLEKFDFQREGLFRDRWLVHGRWCDSLMMGLVQHSSESTQAGSGM